MRNRSFPLSDTRNDHGTDNDRRSHTSELPNIDSFGIDSTSQRFTNQHDIHHPSFYTVDETVRDWKKTNSSTPYPIDLLTYLDNKRQHQIKTLFIAAFEPDYD